MGLEGGYEVQSQILSADSSPFIRVEDLTSIIAELTLGCLLLPCTCAWQSLVRVYEGIGVSGFRFFTAEWSHRCGTSTARCGYGNVSGEGWRGRVSGYWGGSGDCQSWVATCGGRRAKRRVFRRGRGTF